MESFKTWLTESADQQGLIDALWDDPNPTSLFKILTDLMDDEGEGEIANALRQAMVGVGKKRRSSWDIHAANVGSKIQRNMNLDGWSDLSHDLAGGNYRKFVKAIPGGVAVIEVRYSDKMLRYQQRMRTHDSVVLATWDGQVVGSRPTHGVSQPQATGLADSMMFFYGMTLATRNHANQNGENGGLAAARLQRQMEEATAAPFSALPMEIKKYILIDMAIRSFDRINIAVSGEASPGHFVYKYMAKISNEGATPIGWKAVSSHDITPFGLKSAKESAERVVLQTVHDVDSGYFRGRMEYPRTCPLASIILSSYENGRSRLSYLTWSYEDDGGRISTANAKVITQSDLAEARREITSFAPWAQAIGPDFQQVLSPGYLLKIGK